VFGGHPALSQFQVVVQFYFYFRFSTRCSVATARFFSTRSCFFSASSGFLGIFVSDLDFFYLLSTCVQIKSRFPLSQDSVLAQMQLLEPVKALSDWQETAYYSTRVTVSNTCFWRSSWSSLWTVERTLPAYKDDLEHLEDMEPPAFWLELKQITDCNWRRNYVDRGYVHCTPPSSGLVVLYPLYPPSQRCGLCQNFKKSTFIRFVQICTPLPLTKTFRRAWCQAKIWCSAWANVYTCGTVFSQVNIVKTKQCNKLMCETVSNRLLAKQAVKKGGACHTLNPCHVWQSGGRYGRRTLQKALRRDRAVAFTTIN